MDHVRVGDDSRRAVVTGGGAGIGRAICVALADAGCRVAVLDINAETAQQTVDAIRCSGGDAFALVASMAESSQVATSFAAVKECWGGIDILVNNAGVSGNRPTLDLTDDEWLRTVGINQTGVFYGCREAGRMMRAQGGGAIVNIGSIYSLVAAPNRLHYCATKAAVGMMTKSLAVEWAEYGITVNCVAPGYVETALIQDLERDGRIRLSDIRERTPQKRLAHPEEIAHAVVYFCAPESAHITGQILAVDGGWSAYGYL